MAKIFIDGSAGTTGLRIYERIAERPELEVIRLSEEKRKDPAARAEALNQADIAFLCLPDAAAIEAVGMVTDPETVIIDTSTAHRVADGWTYGFAELHRAEQIAAAKRIANPGCHASGFISLAAPLVEAGIIPEDLALSCFSLTGYSGGGKKMIAEYEAEGRDPLLDAPRMYGLTQKHKHLPEMAKISGLRNDPVFCPIVAPYYAGMEVVIPLHRAELSLAGIGEKSAPEAIREVYRTFYQGSSLIHVLGEEPMMEGGYLSAGAFSGRDDMEISVAGGEDRILLISRFDNLGKGASGAAIQNMNLVLGVPETTGLVIGG